MLIKHLIEPALLEPSDEPITRLLLDEDNPGDVRAVEESDEALTIKALNTGAQDYLVKGETDRFALARRLRFAIERGRSSIRSVSAEPPNPSRMLALFVFVQSKG